VQLVAVLKLLGGLQAGLQRGRLKSARKATATAALSACPPMFMCRDPPSAEQVIRPLAVVVRDRLGRVAVNYRQLAAT
jgi:hypothetical protein